MTISARANFGRVLKQINCIDFSCFQCKDLEPAKYALLELLNNSIRAHREKNENRDIFVEFTPRNDFILITVKDWGGGFDKSILPYDLNTEITEIDTNGEIFQWYREEHGYQRFGMGIYVAKKVFPSLQIEFFDRNENIVEWSGKGSVEGTIITMQMGVVDESI